MTIPIQTSDLQAGDVLLYSGTSWVSRMIRLFDGSDYSHSAIYDGSSIAEVVADGIVSGSIAASIKEAKYVDIRRFRSSTGEAFDDPGYGAQPVIDRVGFYVAQGGRYAYEGIVLLAFLAATRRLPFDGWIPGLGKMLRTIFDSAADVLNRMISAGKEPMVCSEFVYRCYAEAGHKYRIAIVGADLRMQSSIHDRLKSGVTPFAGNEEGNQEEQELAASAEEFLHLFAAAKKTETLRLAIPDFVTPKDMATSPNLVCLGTLKG